MNLFRSEGHIERWLGTRDPGAIIPVDKLSEPAHAWLSDAVAPDWQPRSLEQETSDARPGANWGVLAAALTPSAETLPVTVMETRGTWAGERGADPTAALGRLSEAGARARWWRMML